MGEIYRRGGGVDPRLGSGPRTSLFSNTKEFRSYRSYYRDGGLEQLISNGERFKPAFAERDKKQAMIDLRGTRQTGLQTIYVPHKVFKIVELTLINIRRPFFFMIERILCGSNFKPVWICKIKMEID